MNNHFSTNQVHSQWKRQQRQNFIVSRFGQQRLYQLGVAMLLMLLLPYGPIYSKGSWELTKVATDRATVPSAVAKLSAIPAFPGAEGFGSLTVGGRGGRVIEVTNLNDSGPGSLRAAIDAEGPRIVVFRVGGTIELRSRIDIANPFITIAGQTAPGGGITLKNHPSVVHSPLRVMTHDVVIRYLRSRPGPSAELSDVLDALTISAGYNIIIDHSSFSWGTDEVFNIWYDVHDVTVQWSIISEGLHFSTHPEGGHSNGMLIGSDGAGQISIHHNLFAHNRRRNPKVNMTGTADVVNNVIYNARYAMMIQDTYASPKVNYEGNVVIHGHDSVYDFDVRYWNDGNHPPSIYVKGNLGPKRPDNTLEDFWVVRLEDRPYLVDERQPAPAVTTYPACTAYFYVLADAGVTVPMRDAVDERIVNDVIHRTGKLVNDPAEVGGWPDLPAGEAPTDSDHDGMPDAWETIQGFAPHDPNDGALDADGDGYTNVEEYLNTLASNYFGLVPAQPAAADAADVDREGELQDLLSVYIPNVSKNWPVPNCNPAK
ncbi:MAG: hypothetical protein R2932_57655 [Caldilineaceae bacterium]